MVRLLESLPLVLRLVDCSTSAYPGVKRAPQDSASMPSAFGARTCKIYSEVIGLYRGRAPAEY